MSELIMNFFVVVGFLVALSLVLGLIWQLLVDIFTGEK